MIQDGTTFLISGGGDGSLKLWKLVKEKNQYSNLIEVFFLKKNDANSGTFLQLLILLLVYINMFNSTRTFLIFLILLLILLLILFFNLKKIFLLKFFQWIFDNYFF